MKTIMTKGLILGKDLKRKYTFNKFRDKEDLRFFKNRIVEDEALMTKIELAQYLNVSVKMIDRKVSMNEIPYLKIGRLVRFNRKEIQEWLMGNSNKG